MPELERTITASPAAEPPAVIDLRDLPHPLPTDSVTETDQAIALRQELDRAERELAIGAQYATEALAPTGARDLASRILPHPELIDETPDIATLFDAQRFIREAPRFREQVSDETRITPFRYTRGVGKVWSMTEHEGLRELDTFLTDSLVAIEGMSDRMRAALRPASLDLVAEQAPSMRESLTFLGEAEYQEAVQGLAERWKAYLRANPTAQLCVVAEIGGFDRYKHMGKRKSDDKLREDVLLAFTNEELEEFGGRIVGKVEHITRPPQDCRIVMVDDWTISGTQMRDLYHTLSGRNTQVRTMAQLGNVEINLLTAKRDYLTHGFKIDPYRPSRGVLPVYAYFLSHHAPLAKRESNGHVSGLHSTVNWDFATTLRGMQALVARFGVVPHKPLALASIEAQYAKQPPVLTIGRNGVQHVRAGRK